LLTFVCFCLLLHTIALLGSVK